MPKQFNNPIIESPWSKYAQMIQQIRRSVFIDEQKVPEKLEWDGLDESAIHLVAFGDSNSEIIAYGRLLPHGKLTRMAVALPFRNRGYGRAIVQMAFTKARNLGLQRMTLDAQVHACDFYRKLGFSEQGEPFLDAGIEHMHMSRDLTQPPDHDYPDDRKR